jgi:hypothetical protein
MALITFECKYCGRKWDKLIYSQLQGEKEACACGDKRLIARVKESIKKIDYYQGSTPFPDQPTPLETEEELRRNKEYEDFLATQWD